MLMTVSGGEPGPVPGSFWPLVADGGSGLGQPVLAQFFVKPALNIGSD
jgi:hypothetical protein